MPFETDTYKEFSDLLGALRKKKEAVSRLEDALGNEKGQLLTCEQTQAVADAQQKAKAAQCRAREQLDELREFMATNSKAFFPAHIIMPFLNNRYSCPSIGLQRMETAPTSSRRPWT